MILTWQAQVNSQDQISFVVVRSLDHQARKNLKLEANSSDEFIAKEWDTEIRKVAAAGNKILLKAMINRRRIAIKKVAKPLLELCWRSWGMGRRHVIDSIY